MNWPVAASWPCARLRNPAPDSASQSASQSKDKREKIEGIPTREPEFGIPAVWISPDRVEAAWRAGYTVVDTISIVGTHLGEVVRRHARELFSRQEAKKVLDRVNEENSKVVE